MVIDPFLIAGTLIVLVLVTSWVGPRGKTAILAIAFPLLVGPLATMVWMPGETASYSSIPILLLFCGSIVLPLLWAPKRSPHRPSLESSIANSSAVRGFLFWIAIAILAATAYTMQVLLSNYSITSLYEMNEAYADRYLPSFGLAGRVSRLSMPVGIVCFVLALNHPKGKARLHFLGLSILMLACLIGVRRSTIFYEVGFMLFLWLSRQAQARRLLRSGVGASIVVMILIAFFGFIQIDTHKALSDSVVEASIEGALLYVGGNIPYGECLLTNPGLVSQGTSFPIVSYISSALSGETRMDLSKPFCVLSNGQAFNTSPAYVDVHLDFGEGGVILFGLMLGLLMALGVSGINRLEGVQAMTLTIVAFTVRENMLGMLDVVQALLAYPVLVAVLISLSHGQVGQRKMIRRDATPFRRVRR